MSARDRLASVRDALDVLELALQDANLFGVEELPHDLRWRLHVLASSRRDYTFWIEEVDGGWRATEVESGVSGAVEGHPRNALDAYWAR